MVYGIVGSCIYNNNIILCVTSQVGLGRSLGLVLIKSLVLSFHSFTHLEFSQVVRYLSRACALEEERRRVYLLI